MSNSLKNFYIFTGKGGVGKTTAALLFAQYLHEQQKDVLYVTLSQQKLGEASAQPPPKNTLKVPQLFLELEDCAQGYIQKKLGSSTIAQWVVRSAYFRALVNMLPGFGYLISMGKMLEIIHESQDKKILILDAPASGHALTMLEATKNFREIFQSGLVFEDTNKMIKKLYDPQHTCVRIITLPTELSLQEAIELKDSIRLLAPIPCKIFLNQLLASWGQAIADLPTALQKKVSLEEKVCQEYASHIDGNFPLVLETRLEDQFQTLKPYLEQLV
jgi:anion-transporting  ArsA/GET3 family ATPase